MAKPDPDHPVGFFPTYGESPEIFAVRYGKRGGAKYLNLGPLTAERIDFLKWLLDELKKEHIK